MEGRIPLALLAGALLWSCTGRNYSVTGNLGVKAADSVYLIALDNDRTILASSAVATDGSYRIEGRTDGTEIATLTDGTEALALIFPEKGVIAMNYDDRFGFTAGGTPINDRYRKLNEALYEIRNANNSPTQDATSEERDATAALLSDAVENNTDNMLGVYLFTRSEYRTMELAEARQRVAQFPKKLRQTAAMQHIRASIETAERTAIGASYIELNLASTQGGRIALSDFAGAGKWVLVEFWASWCGHCRKEIHALKEIYEAYEGCGFTIYGVTLDNDAEAWKQYVAENDLAWPNVMAVEQGESPDAERYGIRSIPANFLIDPKGRIAAKNIHGESLKNKLQEILQ